LVHHLPLLQLLAVSLVQILLQRQRLAVYLVQLLLLRLSLAQDHVLDGNQEV
jgi:hypothetical protein